MARRTKKPRKMTARVRESVDFLLSETRRAIAAEGHMRLDDIDRRGVGPTAWKAFRRALKPEGFTMWISSGVEGGEYIVRPTTSAKKRSGARVAAMRRRR